MSFMDASLNLVVLCLPKISQLDSYHTGKQQKLRQEHRIYEPRHEKNLLVPYATNKGADQPAHPRSLISTFIVRSLDSILLILAITEISSVQLVSLAVQAGLSHTWPQTPENRFSRDKGHMETGKAFDKKPCRFRH